MGFLACGPFAARATCAEGSPALPRCRTPLAMLRGFWGRNKSWGTKPAPATPSMVLRPAISLRLSLPSLCVSLCAVPTAVPPWGGLWGAQPHQAAHTSRVRGEGTGATSACPSVTLIRRKPQGRTASPRPQFLTHLGAAARPCIGSRAAPPARPSTWA